jgi:hypothetical protein
MRSTRVALAVAALALSANAAAAQVGTLSNGPVTVTLNATQQATLALSTSAASTSIAAINPGTTTNFPALNVTAVWNLTAGTNVVLVGWFANPAQALTGTGSNIASTRVNGRTGAAAYAPFTGNAVAGQGTAGGTLQLWSVAATPLTGTATTNLDLQLDYTGQAAPAAGNYSGILNLRAVVQ